MDKACALAALGLHVFPCRETLNAKGVPDKSPYTHSGHHDGTTDNERIKKWWTDHPGALVGVAAGPSELVVLDVDMDDNGKDGWFSIAEAGLDVPQTLTYTTARGGDHLAYSDPGTIALGPTKNHATPQGVVLDDVDRRAGSSYFIWWGNEIPADRSVFAAAPAWLLTPAQKPSGLPFAGSTKDWFAQCATGAPGGYIREWVDSIPVTDFGHHEMVAMQASLIHLAVEGEPGIEWAIEQLREQWLRAPYDNESFAADFDKSLAGGIARLGQFPPNPADIATVDHVPLMSTMQAPLFDLFTNLPTDSGNPAALRQRAARVGTSALASGFSAFDAAVLVLRCSAAEGLRSAPDKGVSEAWAVVGEVLGTPVYEDTPVIRPEDVDVIASFGGMSAGAAVAPRPAGVIAPAKPPIVKAPLLKPAEMDWLATERATLAENQAFLWWGDEFMWVQEQTHAVLTDSYYRLNRWMILSLLFASKAIVPLQDDSALTLNIYGAIVGPSGTGKSKSLEPVKSLLKMLEDSPDIGGNATVGGLIEKLIERDAKTSWFHADEADRILKDWSNDRGEFRGMKQGVTDIYGGEVPAIQRATKKEISGIHAKAFMSVHLTGVFEKVTDAIEPGDWESGFINRFVWARGERKPRTRESKRLRIKRQGSDTTTPIVGTWNQKWMADFHAIQRRMADRSGGAEMAELDISDEVLDRHIDTIETLEAVARASAYRDRLEPTFTRIEDTIIKCAALVAVTKSSPVVEMEHYLIALEQTEEWLDNALALVVATDESPKVRRVNRLAELIRRAGGVMPMMKIYQLEGFREDYREVDNLVEQLKRQGRVVPENSHLGTIIRSTEGPL